MYTISIKNLINKKHDINFLLSNVWKKNPAIHFYHNLIIFSLVSQKYHVWVRNLYIPFFFYHCNNPKLPLSLFFLMFGLENEENEN